MCLGHSCICVLGTITERILRMWQRHILTKPLWLGLVPGRGRVTDHPKSASYSSKLPTFTTLPELVTTGGLCIASMRIILPTGAFSGSRMSSISTEESSYPSISLPQPPSAIASSLSVSSLLLSRLRKFFLLPMSFFCALSEELGVVGIPAVAAFFLFLRFLAFFSFLHLGALSPPWVPQLPWYQSPYL